MNTNLKIAAMNKKNIENIKSQMRRGVLEYCILCVLDKNDAYASELIGKLKDARIIVVEGTLYPLLTRQKNQGLLTYRWEESTQGPPRKYYTLTDKGRDLLHEMDKAWTEIVETLDILRK
jgi:PadR family transcriptional regulator PadR